MRAVLTFAGLCLILFLPLMMLAEGGTISDGGSATVVLKGDGTGFVASR